MMPRILKLLVCNWAWHWKEHVVQIIRHGQILPQVMYTFRQLVEAPQHLIYFRRAIQYVCRVWITWIIVIWSLKQKSASCLCMMKYFQYMTLINMVPVLLFRVSCHRHLQHTIPAPNPTPTEGLIHHGVISIANAVDILQTGSKPYNLCLIKAGRSINLWRN